MVRIRVFPNLKDSCGTNLVVLVLRTLQVKSNIILGRRLRCGVIARGESHSFLRLSAVERGKTAMCSICTFYNSFMWTKSTSLDAEEWAH